MIISPRHKFAFVHIPKCAGTSIRTQLLKCDDSAIVMGKPGNHKVLGRIDYGHIQLDLLRQHFPDDYQDLKEYTSYAIVRDPLERFGSALRQILWQYEERPMTLIPADELREKTLQMLDKIADEIEAPSAPYIFFARQERFIFDGDTRIVDHLIPVDLVGPFIAYMSQVTGTPMDAGMRSNQNVDLRYKKIGNLAYRVNGFLRARIPLGLHTYIRKAALGVLSSNKQSAASSSGVLDLPEVRAFVEEHYKADIEIYRSVMAGHAELAAGLAAGKLASRSDLSDPQVVAGE